MRLQKLGQRIEQKISEYKYKKHQRFLNKYCRINDDTTAYDSYEKMKQAREVIANYAKHKGVRIEISDARRELGEFDSPVIEDYLSTKISLLITNLKTKLSGKRIIHAIDDKAPEKAVFVKKKRFMINIPGEDTQRIVETKSSFEETFLRYLYRNIEELTNQVNRQ